MLPIMSNFKILSKLNDEFVHNFKVLIIIESGVFIVTKDDQFYVFGKNSAGCLGLGHKNPIQIPTIVPELCLKGIVHLVNGYRHVFAYNNCGEVYCWGRNDSGELGNIYVDNKYKPALNLYLSNSNIIDICCGSDHSLALNSIGEVLAWGSNFFGQCGNGCHTDQTFPKIVYGLKDEKVRQISCGSYHSVVLTESGHVFSWGNNKWGQLGSGKGRLLFSSSGKRNEFCEFPKLVRLKNDGKIALIKKICCGSDHSMLLTGDGDIFVFGKNSWGQLGLGFNQRDQQIIPMIVRTELKFIDIAAHFDRDISAALTVNGDYYVWGKCGTDVQNIPMKTDLDSFNEIFIKYEKITYKPMILSHNFDEKNLSLDSIYRLKYIEEFDEFGLIGFGNYNTVYKVRNTKEDEMYAIKRIALTEQSIEILFSDLKIMAQLSNDYVVKLYSAWIEENYTDRYDDYDSNYSEYVCFNPYKPLLLYIQMELCSKTIRDVIKQLNNELKQKESTEMTLIGYYIASELFKEIVECVDYLHNNNPPIIHLNLKPTNILINNGINGRFVKLSDIGFSKLNKQTNTLDSETMKYMAPEVENGKYDTKADIFSLGVIIQELFNIDIKKYFTTKKHSILRLNYANLFMLSYDLIAVKKDLRPNCSQILKNKWAFSLDDLKNANQFELINMYSRGLQLNEERFHRLFMHKKLTIH